MNRCFRYGVLLNTVLLTLPLLSACSGSHLMGDSDSVATSTGDSSDTYAQVCVDPQTGKRVDDSQCDAPAGANQGQQGVLEYRVVCVDLKDQKQVGYSFCSPPSTSSTSSTPIPSVAPNALTTGVVSPSTSVVLPQPGYGYACQKQSDLSIVDMALCNTPQRVNNGSTVTTTASAIAESRDHYRTDHYYHNGGSSLTPFIWYYLGTRAGAGQSVLPSIGQKVDTSGSSYNVLKSKPPTAATFKIPKTGGSFSDSYKKAKQSRSIVKPNRSPGKPVKEGFKSPQQRSSSSAGKFKSKPSRSSSSRRGGFGHSSRSHGSRGG